MLYHASHTFTLAHSDVEKFSFRVRKMAPLARVCVCSCGAEVLHVPPELAPAVDQYVEPVPRWACPRRSGVLTWLVLLSIPSASFLFLIGPHLAARDGVHLVAAVALTYLVSTTFMALAAFSDPGTIPPNRDPDVRRAVQQRSPVEVTVRGTRLTLKHCATCGIHRPPRSAHCRETNRCVQKRAVPAARPQPAGGASSGLRLRVGGTTTARGSATRSAGATTPSSSSSSPRASPTPSSRPWRACCT